MDDPAIAPDASLKFEREKWEASERRLDQEFALRNRELAFKEVEARRARFWNPLAIAILGASIAAVGSAFVSWENNQTSLALETFKAESARIFEVVKTGNPDIAANNLSFLLDTGLIQNSSTVTNIRLYLSKRKSGEGVTLPSANVSGLVLCDPGTNTATTTVTGITIKCGLSSDDLSKVIQKFSEGIDERKKELDQLESKLPSAKSK